SGRATTPCRVPGRARADSGGRRRQPGPTCRRARRHGPEHDRAGAGIRTRHTHPHRAAGDDGCVSRADASRGSELGAGGSMSPHRLWVLVRREALATLRDPFTVTILVLVPVMALLLFGKILSTKVSGLELGVIDSSQSAASRRLVAELGAQGSFAPR